MIDIDYFIDLIQSFDALVFPRDCPCTVEFLGQFFVKDFVYKRTLTRTGNTCHTGHNSKWNVYINIFQVILLCTDNSEVSGRLFSLFGNRYFDLAAQIGSGDGVLVFHDFLRGSDGDHFSAVLACAGAYVHDAVGGQHGVLIVLYDNQSVAQIPEMLQRAKKLIVVPLMQPDAWLIQNVGDAYQAGADLGSQADPLGLPAG